VKVVAKEYFLVPQKGVFRRRFVENRVIKRFVNRLRIVDNTERIDNCPDLEAVQAAADRIGKARTFGNNAAVEIDARCGWIEVYFRSE
jgi:hypothetical protein